MQKHGKISQSWPEFGLGFEVKALKRFACVPFGSGMGERTSQALLGWKARSGDCLVLGVEDCGLRVQGIKV